MLKKTISIAALVLCGYFAHSQVVYEPIPLPSSGGYPRQQQQSEQAAEVITAYTVNPSTNRVSKYKIKVVTLGKQLKIISYKSISSEYWSSLTLPITATRISMYDALSEQFEYKVYLTPLLTYIYF